MRSESRMATSSSMTRMRDLGMQAGVAESLFRRRARPHPHAQQDLFTARGAPPPLALTRRPGFAGLPSGASLGPQALFTARGAPPPLALTRRPGFAGLPSGASLGPQALFTARGAPPPLALTRRPGFAGLPSGASLGPQALFTARGARPPLAVTAGAALERRLSHSGEGCHRSSTLTVLSCRCSSSGA